MGKGIRFLGGFEKHLDRHEGGVSSTALSAPTPLAAEKFKKLKQHRNIYHQPPPKPVLKTMPNPLKTLLQPNINLKRK